MHFDLPSLIRTFGYAGIFGVVFAESGLLIGFFLPGDSLLFSAGILASQGHLDIWILFIGVFIAAVAGDSTGYALGQRYGRKLFNRPKSLLFHPKHLERAEQFFDKHGKKTIILSRFIPVVRTFTPIIAGIGSMTYKTFITYNIIGGFLWAVGITVLGYFLGKTIPNIDHYLLPGIVLIILLSIAQPVWHLLKDPDHRAQLLGLLSRDNTK